MNRAVVEVAVHTGAPDTTFHLPWFRSHGMNRCVVQYVPTNREELKSDYPIWLDCVVGTLWVPTCFGLRRRWTVALSDPMNKQLTPPILHLRSQIPNWLTQMFDNLPQSYRFTDSRMVRADFVVINIDIDDFIRIYQKRVDAFSTTAPWLPAPVYELIWSFVVILPGRFEHPL